MKSAVIPVVFLLLIAAVHASGLSAVSPAAGSTSDPANGFVFSVESDAKIANCELIIDNTSVKNVPYNDVIKGKVITYTAELEDGVHTWNVQCSSAAGLLATPVMNMTAKNPEDAGIKVKGSGMFRGSMIRSFRFSNAPTQQPVTVPKIAQGDFIGIELSVPPSVIKKELYLKAKSMKDGKQYIVLEDLKGRDMYEIFQGENVTINISTSKVIISYLGQENNRATVIVYPTGKSELAMPETNTTEQLPKEPQLPPAVDPQSPAQENQPEQSNRENAGQPEQKPAQPEQSNRSEEPKQGVFKRMLSWFSNVFG